MNPELLQILMQNSQPGMQTTKAVSTKTKSIADFLTPMSERYGDPADIRVGKTVSKGIPMDMQELRDAMTEILTSPRESMRTVGSQKEIAEQSLGDLLGYSANFNKKREGSKLIKRILDKYNLMNKPGGLVAYITEEGFPTGSTGAITGYFKEGQEGEAPDTIAIFGNKSSTADRRLLRSLVHESIHAGAKKGSPLYDMGKLKMHQKKFDKVEKEILRYNWVQDLLRSAMMKREEDQYQLPEGFIK